MRTQDDDGGELLTVKELAAVLKLQPHTLLTGPLRHSLPFVRLGNGARSQLRVRRSDLRQWLDGHRAAAA